jgi:hypothetical protein
VPASLPASQSNIISHKGHGCCGAGLQEDEALEALRIISAALSTAQLKHLNLSDNALGEKGLRAAAAAFQNPVSSSDSSSRAQMATNTGT